MIGADGTTLRYGSGAPGGGVGNDGDFYIDTVAYLIYGPKAGGVWPAGVSLVGPAGSGAGDVAGPAASIDNEIALFSSTTGKVIKRATTTGILKAASGVIGAASAGSDYAVPGANTDITSVFLSNTGLKVKDTNASHGVTFKPGSDITQDRTLTITTGDADRTLTLSGNATVSQDYSTTGNPQFATIELGAAADTTISRASAGVIAVESVTVPLNSITNTHTALQIELGHASDTTLTRVSAGVVAIEGHNILLNSDLGVAVQAYDDDLASIATLTTTAAGRSALTIADPNADRVVAWDDSAGSMAAIALADLTTEAVPATGDYILIYGAEGDLRKANWSTLPSGSGGLSDIERQNFALMAIYQAKAFIDYRRMINFFADGYKSSNGIAAGSSSLYTVDTANGRFYPTTSGGTFQTAVNPTLDTNSAGWAGTTGRTVIKAAATGALSGMLDRIRLTLTPPTSGNNTVITNCFIGYRGSGAYDFDGNQVMGHVRQWKQRRYDYRRRGGCSYR